MEKILILFVILTFLLISCSSIILRKSVDANIDVNQALKLIQQNDDNEKFVLLDVRTAAEYNKGHLDNAIHINYFDKDFMKEVKKLDKDKIYLVYCASGGRSASAVKKMKQEKFKEVYNLKGGIMAWKKAEQPTVH